MTDVSIIIPTRNESDESLHQICSGVRNALKSSDLLYEIILVTDIRNPEYESIKNRFRYEELIKCISHNGDKNQSESYNTGLENSNGKYIVLIDADMYQNTTDIPRIIKELENGHTFVQGNRLNRDATMTRKFFSWGFNLLVSFVKMKRVRDIGCGLIGFPRHMLEQAQSYPGRIKDLVMLIMLRAQSVRKVDITIDCSGKSNYALKNLVSFSLYLSDHLLEYFWLTRIMRKW